MGYTHYWYRPATLDAEKFTKFSKDCQELSRTWGAPLALYGDDPETDPQFDSDAVIFNGVGDEGCEPFVMDRQFNLREFFQTNDAGRYFKFCKTRLEPYDALVTACLLAFKHHFGASVDVASDGDWKDWQNGWRLYSTTFPDRDAPSDLWSNYEAVPS